MMRRWTIGLGIALGIAAAASGLGAAPAHAQGGSGYGGNFMGAVPIREDGFNGGRDPSANALVFGSMGGAGVGQAPASPAAGVPTTADMTVTNGRGGTGADSVIVGTFAPIPMPAITVVSVTGN